ncbi:MAG: DUF4188 domain-containing protein [Xanthobacteraceae bacterium]|nr:DUF4188 domain-containing protein [Xanthobacteraceae bacterium]
MSQVIAQRMTARIDGDFVVFLIGMRVNRPLKVWKWMPVAAQMPRMLVELAQQPDLGLLHARTHFGLPNIMVVQYWRSFEHLARYASDAGAAHLPAWRAFNRAVGSNGDVGIWHETYLVKAGAHESVYNNMPPFGLGVAGRLEPARGGLATARSRLGLAAEDGPTP